MSLNKFTGNQNSGSERWMNLKLNNLEGDNVTLKGTVKVETKDNAGYIDYATPNLGNPNFVLATDGIGNTSWLYLGDIDPSPSDPNLYTKTQNIDLLATIPNTTQINGTTKLDIVTANSIELDGSDVTDDLADLQIKTTNISYLSGPNVTTVSDTLNNTGLIHASGDVQVDGNLQVQCTDTNLLSYKTPNRGNSGDVLTSNGTGGVSFQPASSGSGDVVGPASSTDNSVAFFDGTTGKLLKEISNIKYNSVDSQLEVPTIQSTTYKEGTYTGSLIKNFPVGSNNTFSFITTPPDLTSGNNNTFYGLYAGDNVEISNNSTCIGVNAMRNSIGAVDRSNNTLVGKNAGQGTASSTFNQCVMLGSSCGEALVTGVDNTFVGYQSGLVATDVNNSVFVGKGAGDNQTTGNDNTFIGYFARCSGGDKTNAIAIGYNATASNSNQCCIGNEDIEKIYNEGNGTCDLGAPTKQFKDLYMTGSVIGSSLPIVTRFRCSPATDRTPTAGNAVYDDAYIRLGWDGAGQNDVQIRRKAGSDAYISYCSKPNTLTVAQVGVNNVEQTYELNGTLSMVGGEIFYINLSPVNDNTAPAYRISVHFCENVIGTDTNVDWIIERFDKCSLI